MYIDGEWTEGTSGKLIDSINGEKDTQYVLKHMIIKKTVAMDYAH